MLSSIFGSSDFDEGRRRHYYYIDFDSIFAQAIERRIPWPNSISDMER